ncbi:cobalt-zinc-cadmium efflux system protein [Novosphingobium sp. SG751A]|uniref:cation diffusion facilitator family transporter n=1 Tax=Novosphingobium sp. SG751A TaxID=2587000 RepID=UPI001556DFB6|nr:cation diffusion facilitator family transporter [Novosphingobium sp. SG751A]NOW47306.1 cobalt-zinc-cadmium efflux system protein [Novosphingobium sp. SG751A]
MGIGHHHHHHHDHGESHGGKDHHGHHHGGGHHHGSGATHGTAFAVATSLNILFVVIETAAGFIGHSTALLADAGHNLSDVLSLLLAWGASRLAARAPSRRFTYGMKSASILAALANAALLWVALGAILIETLQKFASPEPAAAGLMMAVAAAGIAVNGLSALLFARGSKDDLNLRAAFQHLMADAAVSAGVVLAGLAIHFTAWNWIDPVTSLAITLMIALGSWSMLKESVQMGLLAVPASVNEEKLRAFLLARPGIAALHDLHVWPISTTDTAMTAHITMPAGHPGDAFLHALAHDLEHDFGIGHATIQVETDGGHECALHSDEVV